MEEKTKMKNLRIIIFAAHSDDETIGAGASIAKFTEEGQITVSAKQKETRVESRPASGHP